MTAPQRLSDFILLRHRLILGLLYLFLAMEVLSGPLRHYLPQIGLSPLIYLPKLLIFGAIIAATLHSVHRNRVRPIFVACLGVFLAFGIVGWSFTDNLLQSAFGIFALLPLIYAVLAEPAIREAGPRILPFVAMLWLIAALGVTLDYLEDMPWSGSTYRIGEMEIEGSREWSTFGVERVAGFARASYEAADQLLLLALPLIFLYRNGTLKLAIWLATGTLIFLTTTKKTGGAFLILTLLLPLINSAITPALIRRIVMASLPIMVTAIGVGLPLSTFFITYQINLDSMVSQILFASFETRLTVVWPASMNLALERGSAILGRGIGGIGAAQKHFEPLLFMPGDNFYIYLYVTFGVFAIGLTAAYVWNLARLATRGSAWSRMMWTMGVTVLINGWANNGVESPITASFLGITLAYAYAERQSRRAAVRPMHITRHPPISSPLGLATS